ncbi:MAG: sigma-54 dependent transcriptional regulator [Thiobacillaceae bacterium]|nr:sigma-54 dependent transcriptional regulator [Thiobacillaceae bacterium]
MSSKPRILVVEDDLDLREALAETLALNGYAVTQAADAQQALAALAHAPLPGLVLTDVQMPGTDGHALLSLLKARRPELPVVLMTAYAEIDRAVEAMRAGAADYLAKPFPPERLLAVVARHYRAPGPEEDAEFVARDPRTLELLALARRVAATDATVLLTGESGVGKEVLARFIHRHSARAAGPFVAVNCAAIPETLLEATLFGHERGAYTGATAAMPGKFEQAQGGVILLDEIGELPAQLQAKLLRVLQEREVERLGARAPIALDVRVMAATNRDLAAEVRAGRFRADLYYRLNVFPLEIPPLRARRQDIEALARHCLQACAREVGRQDMVLGPAAMAALVNYDWPGNVRELCNVLQRAMILAPGRVIEPQHLMLPSTPSRLTPAQETAAAPAARSLKDLEREAILGALAAAGGSRRRAAELLGMSERTLRYKLARMRERGELEADERL